MKTHPPLLTVEIRFNCPRCLPGHQAFAVSMEVPQARILAVKCPLCHQPLLRLTNESNLRIPEAN